jgi:hypothetical protein
MSRPRKFVKGEKVMVWSPMKKTLIQARIANEVKYDQHKHLQYLVTKKATGKQLFVRADAIVG